jgi:hypothetical protein
MTTEYGNQCGSLAIQFITVGLALGEERTISPSESRQWLPAKHMIAK